MRIEKKFTKGGRSPYREIEFEERRSEIRGPDGQLVFPWKRSKFRAPGVRSPPMS